MNKLIIAALLLSVATSAQAGFKYFGKKGEYVEASETEEERSAREKREAEYREQTKRLESQPEYSQGQQAKKAAPRKAWSPQSENTDMSGVEWRQTRGWYHGGASRQPTAKYGYYAGNYEIKMKCSGRSNYIIWMYSRRGLHKLVCNTIGRTDGVYYVTLDYPDEVWFTVEAPGSWEMTMEKK